MKHWNPYNSNRHEKQAAQQQRYDWEPKTALPWNEGIDLDKFFLPLDKKCIAFPNATHAQRRVLSQYYGLVINSTIAELESVINKLKEPAWNALLESYPVNPEIRKLGERFFDEESRHSEVFDRYISLFCEQTGIERKQLDLLLPKSFGSVFLKAVIHNAKAGGHSFWWVVATVEEVSIEIFKQMIPFKAQIDPLYYKLHHLHFEDEARHKSYAFQMLNLIKDRPSSLKRWYFKKTDLLKAQTLTTTWVLSELHKVFRLKEMECTHPFLSGLKSCLPLFKNRNLPSVLAHLFSQAPYISMVLNTRYHRHTMSMSEHHRAMSLPFPRPNLATLFTAARDEA